ncbi:hypothetical protein NUU61_000965 [Penicillium alfredii]|uniref:Uncharacterized protein n=1 Tax=Penicillium alfredii TaxID=1506179 RepID=A0A9W9GAR1_9EURO|nr:uncharacterized protein NUU61_000965 [Penicillium alfredii]KAJ5115206.1 hypothetical protein NUU61_000965 [Penicillium alfredii]
MKLFAAPLLLAQLTGVYATPWIGTQYVAMVEKTIAEGYTGRYITDDPIMRTSTVEISPTATDPSVISTITEVDKYSPDVTVVNLVVEPSEGVAITDHSYPNFYVNVVYTAPPSCSYTTKQTITTAIPVAVPYAAKGLVEPTKVTTSTTTYSYIDEDSTRTMAFLDPSDIPSDVYSSASDNYKPAMYTRCMSYYTSSGGSSSRYSSGDDDNSRYSGCSKFIWYIGGSEFSGGYCCSDGCHYTWGIPPWGLALAIFFSWFGLFLIIGLIESWFIFRRAMLGQKVRRGLPYGFACLCPILSCLSLLTVKKYPPKSPEEQAVLAAKWKEMSAGSKLGLWLKYMFRRSDPSAVKLAASAPPSVPPTSGPFPPQGPWYPPSQSGPGAPPMAAYPQQGYPPQQGFPQQGYPSQQGYAPQPGYPPQSVSPVSALRSEDPNGQPKIPTVNESERT